MLSKLWRFLARAERSPAEENPLWEELDDHARALEVMARSIREDIARRNTITASLALGNIMRRAQRAYDDVGVLLDEAEASGTIKHRFVKI